MAGLDKSGTFILGDRKIKRLGYGAMQLAGPGVFGPPKDRSAAVAVLREAIESGVNHIDTSDFYGPHITNQIIREALHPYQNDLTIVTKIGARRSDVSSVYQITQQLVGTFVFVQRLVMTQFIPSNRHHHHGPHSRCRGCLCSPINQSSIF